VRPPYVGAHREAPDIALDHGQGIAGGRWRASARSGDPPARTETRATGGRGSQALVSLGGPLGTAPSPPRRLRAPAPDRGTPAGRSGARRTGSASCRGSGPPLDRGMPTVRGAGQGTRSAGSHGIESVLDRRMPAVRSGARRARSARCRRSGCRRSIEARQRAAAEPAEAAIASPSISAGLLRCLLPRHCNSYCVRFQCIVNSPWRILSH
jgi:hypothetical protein